MTNREELGRIGERLVQLLFGGEISTNPYDSQKDLIIDGLNVEVKTQNRCTFNNTFTVNTKYRTNFNKCVHVDRLLFVEFDDTAIITVWECIDRKSGETFTTSDGRRMFGWHVDKMKHLESIRSDVLSSRMRRYSNSSKFNSK